MDTYFDVYEQLKRHEGFRSKPYQCSAGKLTIGYGRNLDDNGITKDEAYQLLLNDVGICSKQLLAEFVWFNKLQSLPRAVLLNMCFNLGISRLRKFKKTLKFFEEYQLSKAADEMLDSKWEKQVGKRAIELSDLLRTFAKEEEQYGSAAKRRQKLKKIEELQDTRDELDDKITHLEKELGL